MIYLRIPEPNIANDSSASDSDSSSSDSSASVEFAVQPAPENLRRRFPRIENGPYSSSTESVQESDDSDSSSITSTSSQSSGSYVNFSSFSVDEVSNSPPSDRPVENVEEWSSDSLEHLLNISDLSSLETNISGNANDPSSHSPNRNDEPGSPNPNQSYPTFNFEVQYEQNIVSKNVGYKNISSVFSETNIPHNTEETFEKPKSAPTKMNSKSFPKNNILHTQSKNYSNGNKLTPQTPELSKWQKIRNEKIKWSAKDVKHMIRETRAILKHLEKPDRIRRNSDVQQPKDSDDIKSTVEKNYTPESVKTKINFEPSQVKQYYENYFHDVNDVNHYYNNKDSSDVNANQDVNYLKKQCPSMEETINLLDRFNIDSDQHLWHPYTFNTGVYNREKLRVVEVVAEKSFVLDRQIIEWVTFGYHAVGRGNHGLTLVTSDTDGIHIENLEFDEYISTMSMFEWWNPEERNMNTALITAQDSSVRWYSVQENNQITQLWTWELYSQIKHISLFQHNGQFKIAVTFQDDIVSIYGLDLWKTWWYDQRFNGSSKPLVINNGEFIAVIQSDMSTVSVLKYNTNTRLYAYFENLTSPGIAEISAFTAGPYNFLAIGGDNSAIYQINADGLQEKTLRDYRLQHVELWLPIKLGYYRNDILLLFQHRLEHSSHSSTVLEALQWNGESFTLLEHSPCIFHDVELFGFSCILDADGEMGLRGASVFHTTQGGVNILTASEEFTPIMFQVKTELVECVDPVQQEIKSILAFKKSLQDKYLSQQRILENAKKMMHRDFHKNIEIVAADNWKIKELRTPSVRVKGKLKDYLQQSDTINIAGRNVKNIDFDVDMSQLFDKIKNNHLRIQALVHKLKNAVTKNEGLGNTLRHVKIKGRINVKGNTYIKNSQIHILNGGNVNNILSNSIKKPKNRNIVIKGKKLLKNLKINNLDIETINGLNIIDPSKTSQPIIVEGDLEILNHVNVLNNINLGEKGTFNGINLKSDIFTAKTVHLEDEIAPINFDSIKVDDKLIVKNKINGYEFTARGLGKAIEEMFNNNTNEKIQGDNELDLQTLFVGKHLNFNYINGRPWKDFIDRIIFKSKNSNINLLRVDGKITVEKLIMSDLNSLQFPQDFFLQNEASSAIISAPKTFTTPVHVSALDCDGKVSGVVPQNIVTLELPQNLNNFTFYDLTVTERLDVKGEITGKELDAFLSNPPITETSNIKSNVIFKNLTIKGNVVVQNKINGSNWKNIFEDVIVKSKKALAINSQKTFEGNMFVNNGINVQSGFINNHRIKDFMTVDTEQDIKIGELSGDIAFKNLQVDGLFDGVNITDLIDNTVKLSGDQTVMGDLIFEDDFDNPENVIIDDRAINVEVKSLEITHSCNDWMVSDAINVNNDHITLQAPEFNNLVTDELIIDGNLLTSFTISGENLDDFNSVRLSKTMHREVTAPYDIVRGKIKNLDFKNLNGKTKSDISDFVRTINNIDNEIITGNVKIRNLHVRGKLDISKINNIDIHQLAEEAVWLKKDNYIPGPITFVDTVNMKDIQVFGNVCEQNFENFIWDIVRTTDDSIIFTGKKTYANGLDITGKVTTNAINSIPMSNLMNTKTEQTLEGTAYLNGNISIYENIQTDGMINGVKNIMQFVTYAADNEYHLQGDVSLAEGTIIGNMFVDGLINNLHNPDDVLNSIVSVYENNYFENNLIFSKPVTFMNNLNIMDDYNGIIGKDFLQNTVFINKYDVIRSPIHFNEPLTVHGLLNIQNNLRVDTIQKCSIEEWKSGAIFLDQRQYISGHKHFHKAIIMNNITVKSVNNLSAEDLVKANNYYSSGKFDNVFADEIVTKGNVNFVNLGDEIQNRLMKNNEQTVESPIYFHSNVFITNNASIKAINGKYFDNIQTVNSDSILKGNYIFYGNTTFEHNLNISGTVNNLELDNWMNNAVFANDMGEMHIKGKWNTSGDVYFQKDVSGGGIINGHEIREIVEYLSNRNSKAAASEKQFSEQYTKLCNYLNNVVNILNGQEYLYKSIEKKQSLSFSGEFLAHNFKHSTESFMIISKIAFCASDLWKWSEDGEVFEKQEEIETGNVILWLTVKKDIHTYLISLSAQTFDCAYTAMELWSFDGMTLQHINSFPLAKYVKAAINQEGSFFSLHENYLCKYEILNNNGEIRLHKYAEWSINNGLMEFFPYASSNVFLTDRKNIIYKYFNKNETNSIANTDMKISIAFKEKRLLDVTELIEFTVGIRHETMFAAVWSNLLENVDDAITIYEDPFEGRIFQKILSSNPSSLQIIQLDSFQTLLMFIENFQTIKIYSYRGFQGFKYLHSLDFRASKLELFSPKRFKIAPCIILNESKLLSVHCINYLSQFERICN